MSGQSFKAPPLLTETSNYESWLKEIKLWQCFTDLAAAKQAPAICLTLQGKAREAVLELTVNELHAEDGVAALIKKLDGLYLKDKTEAAFEAYDAFERLRRTPDMSMNAFIIEFERLHNKTKQHGCDMSSNILAYRLLQAANISEQHQQLARATLTELTYEAMKTQLRKIFGSNEESQAVGGSLGCVKVEPIMKVEHSPSFRGADCVQDSSEDFYEKECEDEDEVYYAQNTGSVRRISRGQRMRGNPRQRTRARGGFRRGLNPRDTYGNITRCTYCESINHWYADCPDKDRSGSQGHDIEITLFQSAYETDESMNQFLGEALNAAILDSGASKTVCGQVWLNCYLDTLPIERRSSVQYLPSSSIFRFGDGKTLQAKKCVKLPACIGEKRVVINCDVVEGSLPMLLSKPAMKKAGTFIDFKEDLVSMFGEKQNLVTTQSGHYAVALNKERNILARAEAEENLKITFIASSVSWNEKEKVALKLHRQFSHPPVEKLLRLIDAAGYQKDSDLKRSLREVSESCTICRTYRAAPRRPVVGLPIATQFNECVSMDLKQLGVGTWIFHMIDAATRFSAAVIVRTKQTQEIIKHIYTNWIGIFGPPKRFLTDNGGEFSSGHFRDMCEQMNIIVNTTAAEAPWSNGLCERINAVVAETLRKTVQDVQCDLETALAWTINAKNSLHNVHGFSPYQLVFGKNPNLPCVMNSKPPALSQEPTQEQLRRNLNAMYRARQAYIESESSERIKRALTHKCRSSVGVKYVPGDNVYYKRNDSYQWKGPGKVLGQDGQQVLVKHGGVYVRVHPCRLMLTQEHDQQWQLQHQKLGLQSQYEERGSFESRGGSNAVATLPEYLEEDNITESKENSSNQAEETATTPQRELREQVKDMTSPKKAIVIPRSKTSIKYREKEADPWKFASVVSRAGKATGKYRNFMNMQATDGRLFELDFGNVEWQPISVESSDDMVEDSASESLVSPLDEIVCLVAEEVEAAKQRELKNWISENVYSAVADSGQNALSVRWVLTQKVKEDKLITKARLVARGYEEQGISRKDSPTCNRENLRVALTVIAAKDWKCHSLDVKAAFLQSQQMEREVYLKPPKEAAVSGILWKLNKCVYGLIDASRIWYLTIKQKLLEQGAQVSSFDQAVFLWYKKDELQGILMCHVDDFLYAGSAYFMQEVIEPFKTSFNIGTENETTFRYIGLNLHQTEKAIVLGQGKYIDIINTIDVAKARRLRKDSDTTEEEKTEMRSLIGQLNWAASQTRPDMSFDVCEISTRIKASKVTDLLDLNKIVRKVQRESVNLIFSKLESIELCTLHVFADASYANLNDGGSQGGYIILLVDRNGKCCPLDWSSKRIKRVVKSTLAAETLSMVEAAEAAFFLATFLGECIKRGTPLGITCWTDNKSLYEAVYSTKDVLDKRLRIDIAILREMVHTKEIQLQWINHKYQLSDCLTKRGASAVPLLEVLRTGVCT